MSNPLFLAYIEADFVGRLIFLSLLALSVISWVVFIQKARGIRKMRRSAHEFKLFFEKTRERPLSVQIAKPAPLYNPFFELYLLLKEESLQLLKRNQEGEEGESSSVLYPADIDLLSAYLGALISSFTKEREKNLFILSTVVTLGPFIGLLGTVWGILTTFSHLGAKNAGSNEAILSGLAMALGTTILGLVVAIPALIAYNYLKNFAKEFQTEMEDFSTLMLGSVELHYRKR